MARAMVELVGSASYTVNGRKFTRNSPQLLTDPDEIHFFQNRPGFRVKIIEEPTKAKEAKKADLKKLDKELAAVVEKPAKKKKKKAKKEEKKAEPVVPKYTKEKLLAFKKSELSKLADEMGVEFDGPVKRLRMIEAILQKQEG